MQEATVTPEVERPRGKELMRQVVNQILQNPETWKQNDWHCGTAHCVGGWAEMIGEGKPSNNPGANAMRLLEIDQEDAEWLFAAHRGLPEIHAFAVSMLAGEEFFPDGYNRDGYNRAGYNRDGYNRDGYNRAGYNRDGYNRDGARLPLL